MSSPAPVTTSAVRGAGVVPARSVVIAAALDIAAVLAFVVVGRRSHAEGVTLSGVAGTVWPFLVALALGWAAARAWRAPTALRTGVVVWACTVVVGLVLRQVSRAGAPLSFAVVTAVVLAAGVLGWRGVVALKDRRRG